MKKTKTIVTKAIKTKKSPLSKVVSRKSETVAEKPQAVQKPKLKDLSIKKRLGKSLEDISHLFLSNNKVRKKAAVKAVIKEKKAPVAAVKKTVRSKKALSAPKEKEAPAKAKQTKPTEKTVMKLKPVSKAAKKNAEVISMGLLKGSGDNEKESRKDKVVSAGISSEADTQNQSNKKNGKLGPISELKSLLKKPSTRNPETVPQQEQIIEDSKFFVAKAAPAAVVEPAREFADLPAGYADTRIVIQVRDPYWLHAYWEINQARMNEVRQEYGPQVDSAKRQLRVYDVSGIIFNGSNANRFFSIDINDYAMSWYVNTNEAGRSYCVDIGLLLPNGQFVVLARSNFVTTPIDGPSMVTDEEWMIVEDDFNRLYGLAAGLGIGLGSQELRKQIKKKVRDLSSGMLSSAGLGRKAAERKFWLVVNTELIVYGATEPGADVTVQGKPIKLNADGTFSLRFALPDGEQVIPVKAVSPDKIEERVITPVVKKKTV